MIRTAAFFAAVSMLIGVVWHLVGGHDLGEMPSRLVFVGTLNGAFGALLVRYRIIEPFP